MKSVVFFASPLSPVALLFLALIAIPSAVAQSNKPLATTLLFGRVVLDEHDPALVSDDYTVGVYMHYVDEDKRWPIRYSTGDLYCYRAIMGKTASVYFWTKGYAGKFGRANLISNIYGQAARPDVHLKPEIAQQPDTPLDHMKVRRELDAQAEAANFTGDYDLFQWNLALMESAYRTDPTSETIVSNYEVEKQSAPFMAPEYTGRRGLYAAIIARNGGEDVPINVKSLIRLAEGQGESLKNIFPAIRVQAMEAMTQEALDATVRGDFLTYLRGHSNDAANPLFRATYVTLAKIGDSDDKQWIIDGLQSPETDRVLASIIAVGKARLAGGRTILRSLAGGSNPDPEVTLAAKIILKQWDTEQPPPLTSFSDIWDYGVLNTDLQIQSKTFSDGPGTFAPSRSWFRPVFDGDKQVLEIDYPGDPLFGYVQFSVPQTGTTPPRTVDYSQYTDIMIEMKSDTPGESIKVGVKGVPDTEDTISFESSVPNITTQWEPYRISLSAGADENQLQRLKNVTVAVQLSFHGKQPQRLYIRRLYFARP